MSGRYVSPIPLLAASDAVNDARRDRNRQALVWALWCVGWVAVAAIPGSGVWFAVTHWPVLDTDWRKVVVLAWIVLGAVLAAWPAGLLCDHRYLRPDSLRGYSETLTDARRRLRDEQRQDDP